MGVGGAGARSTPLAFVPPGPSNLLRHGSGTARSQVSLLYAAAACLVAAQLLGVFGLKTRKADLVFSLFMIGLVAVSLVLGYMGARRQLG